MPSVEVAIRTTFANTIACTDTPKVEEALRRIAADRDAGGLSVALLVAWQQGLAVGHIPGGGADALRTIRPTSACPYTFVHVPVRRFRSDNDELARRGILARDADPALLTYHEDALIGPFRFPEAARHGLPLDDVRQLLDVLARQGALIRTTAGDAHVRFADPALRRRLERSGEPLYLPAPHSSPALPANLDGDARAYVARTLARRRQCNYCSGRVLNRREATIPAPATGLGTERDYRFGFTFAPAGDPADVCHALAWDDPPAGRPILSMEGQPYSASDLIRLVRTINRDVRRFCRGSGADLPPPMSGTCSHWAGNSIFHQHYQLLRLREIPLLRNGFPPGQRPLATVGNVEIRRSTAPWPAPAFVVRPAPGATSDDLLQVAGRVAREWQYAGEDAANRTQNLLVTQDRGRTVLVFIPRYRDRVNTSVTTLPGGLELRKRNAGVLEMAGYFVIDDPGHFDALASLTDAARRRTADAWLAELAPDGAAVAEFEARVAALASDLRPAGEHSAEASGDGSAA